MQYISGLIPAMRGIPHPIMAAVDGRDVVPEWRP